MEKRGINGSQLSLMLPGANKTYIAGVLGKKQHTPSIERFAEIAQALGISMGALFYGEELEEIPDSILTVFLKLDSDQRQAVLQMIAALVPDDNQDSSSG